MNEFVTGRAQKRAESDGRILQAAAKIFGSQGYSQATLTAIAAEAGVSQGLVSQRFHSKEHLLLEVFDQTDILSLYDNESRHLPQAFYVLLDQLKREVKEEPDWFRFLSMIHTGKDTPKSFEEHAKEMFFNTTLNFAIVEAQKQNDLPAGDPWDIFRVFFRNATNLIGWYHEFGLPMPEDEYFLYAIQYSKRQKKAVAMLKSQDYEIKTLKTDRDILFTAVSDLYPLIVYSNLTKNTYYMLEYNNFTTRRAKDNGVYDDLIQIGASTIPNKIHREQFIRLFGRENVINAYEHGKKQLCLRHLQTGDDGLVRWIETRSLFKGCSCGEIITITLSRQIDDEMERLHSYGEALQNAELAAGAKTRFLTNLSHEIRNPMNAVVGYTELMKLRADNPEKVRDYAEKQKVSEKELMDLLAKALDAANLSVEDSRNEIRLNINECCGAVIGSATKVAEQRGVELDHKVKSLRDNFIYADEIRLQKSVLSLIVRIINKCVSGDKVMVTLEQLDDLEKEYARMRLTVQHNRVGMNDGHVHCVFKDMEDIEYAALDLGQINDEITALGGSIDLSSQNDGNSVVCAFRFRRAD